MVNLEIPNRRQAPKSTTCGPVCVQMILEYMGIEESLEQICVLCDFNEEGTFETSIALGLYALDIPSTVFLEPDGYRIKGQYAHMPRKAMIKSLKLRSKKAKEPASRRGYRELAEAAEKDLCELKVATRRQIEAELDAGNPWIVAVQAYHFYDKSDKNSYRDRKDLVHFIIIQGYDEDSFIVNDPAADGQGISIIDKDYLLYCMYSSGSAAICVEVNSVADIRSSELALESGAY